jgi:enoyl-CoA hydratase
MLDTTVLKVTKHDDYTASVVLCDPRKGNPMGVAFWDELPKVFDGLDTDNSVRAITLSTEQAHFSFGLDLMGMGEQLMPAVHGGMAGRTEIERLGKLLQNAFGAVARCSKPTVAAVSGWCIGAGLELLAACDIRVCAADAKFSLREVRMGMVCDLGGIQRLPHVIGEGNARLLALTGANNGTDKRSSPRFSHRQACCPYDRSRNCCKSAKGGLRHQERDECTH